MQPMPQIIGAAIAATELKALAQEFKLTDLPNDLEASNPAVVMEYHEKTYTVNVRQLVYSSPSIEVKAVFDSTSATIRIWTKQAVLDTATVLNWWFLAEVNAVDEFSPLVRKRISDRIKQHAKHTEDS